MTYRRPVQGEPADLILSAAFQGDIVDVVNAFKRGDLTKKTPQQRRTHTVMAENTTGQPIKAGQPIGLMNDQTISAQMLNSFLASPTLKAVDLTWHDNITEVAIAETAISVGQVGTVAVNTWSRAKAADGTGDWLMIDPEDVTQFKRATGGIARVMNYDLANSTAIADFTRQQNLWRYRLKEDVTETETGQAELLDLEGEVYADDVEIQFGPTSPLCLKAETEGFCLLGGNKFYSLGTASAYLGDPVEKQIVKAGEGPTGSAECRNGTYCIDQEFEKVLMFPACEESENPVPETKELICIDADTFFTCLDLCQWICDNCTWMDYSTDCDPPPCDEKCIYEAMSDPSGPGYIWEPAPATDCTEPGCYCPPVPDGTPPPTSLSDTLELDCGPLPGDDCFTGQNTTVVYFSAELSANSQSLSLVSGGQAQNGVINFRVNVSSGLCQTQEEVDATATSYRNNETGCCSVEVVIQPPNDECLATGWGDGRLFFPFCQGGSVPADCSPPGGCINENSCSAGPFATATIDLSPVNDCGPAVTSIGVATLGSKFVDENPELFRTGCGSCRRDTITVINRWKDKKPSLQQVGILASTIHNKNPKVPIYDIVEKLIRFMGMENDKP